jgi:phospholipid/cholesterol/gamma-HCH transport system permease protein
VRNPIVTKLGEIGRGTIGASEDITAFLQMLGSLCIAILGVLAPAAIVAADALTYQLYRVGWQAIPIIVLITFLIGRHHRPSRAFSISENSARIPYVVDMVGILVLRELGVLIVAIMVAGRSGSAYTAELGSMKMREEIDALSTMGLDRSKS